MADKKGTQTTANRLYTKATALLREKHADEFDTILDGLYEGEGLVRKVRLTAEQRAAVKAEEERAKAAETIRALLEKHPDLSVEVSGAVHPGGLDEFAKA